MRSVKILELIGLICMLQSSTSNEHFPVEFFRMRASVNCELTCILLIAHLLNLHETSDYFPWLSIEYSYYVLATKFSLLTSTIIIITQNPAVYRITVVVSIPQFIFGVSWFSSFGLDFRIHFHGWVRFECDIDQERISANSSRRFILVRESTVFIDWTLKWRPVCSIDINVFWLYFVLLNI